MVHKGAIQFLHRFNVEFMELASNLFPKGSLGLPFFPGGLEKRAAQLLNLVNQKGQHHKQDEHFAEMLLAQAEVMAELVALVLQGIERLVLYFPSGTGAAHKLVDILFGDVQIRNPAKMLPFAGFCVDLPIFDKGYPLILVRLVERGMIHDAETMAYVRIFLVIDGQLDCLTIFYGLIDMLKEKFVAPSLTPRI